MMMAWMALRSHMGVHEWESHLGIGAQGGGGRRAKPLLQGSWEERDWKEEWKWDLTRTLNHLSAQRAGGI